MSLLFSKRSLQPVVGRVSKLTVGSVMAFTMIGSPAITYAQAEFSEPTLNTPIEEPLLAQSSFSTIEEKIGWLDTAVLSLDNAPNEENDSDQINRLRSLARSYSDLGEQARAVHLLDRAVEIALDSESSYQEALRTVPAYIQIGEIEAAEALIVRVVASSNDIHRTDDLMEIVKAYSATGNTDLVVATLSLATDYLERLAAQDASAVSIHNIVLIAQTYEQVVENTATEDGLSRLVALIEAELETYGTDFGFLAFASSQLSIVQSQLGNTAEAEVLAAQAMKVVLDNKETGYLMGKVATAYGYIEDEEVVERALSEMTELVISQQSSSSDWLGPLVAIRGIAIAYEKIGDTTKSEEALAVITDKNDGLSILEPVLSIYIEMGNRSGQEATIQKMFDKLPLLREAELIVYDGTARQVGIDGLVEGYVHTADDMRAQERLAALESFFKEVPFDPLGTPGQLAILARAAASRGDYEPAQRLLVEAVQLLEVNGCQAQCVDVMSSLAQGYAFLENSQAKQAGFEKLKQIADDNLDAEERDLARSYIIRYRAVL